MAKLKIFHLITRLVEGGAEAKTIAELEGLRDKYDFALGHGAAYSPDQANAVQSLGIPIKRFSLIRHYNPISLGMACYQVYRYLKREKFDVVHTHSTEAGIVGRIAAKWACVPVVVHTIHGVPFTDQRHPLLRKFLLWQERRVQHKTTCFISNADLITQLYLDNGIGRRDQFVTIYSGIDLDEFSETPAVELTAPTEKFKVLTATRLVEGKGLGEFLEAAEQTRQTLPDAVFFICGKGRIESQLQKEIAKKGLEDRVMLLGYCNPIAATMKAADVFVLASYREGTPRVISEAMACGLPVIATNIDGVPEQITDGENGLLIPPRQTQPLVDALLAMLKDESMRIRMAEAGRARSQKFSLKKMLTDLDNLYQDLWQRHQAKSAAQVQGTRVL